MDGAPGPSRRRMRGALAPWSLVGASVVVGAEASLFLATDAVAQPLGQGVLGVAVVSGAVGVLRLWSDHRAGVRAEQLAVQHARRTAARADQQARSAAAQAPFVLDLPAPRSVLPAPRRSHEDASTGPMSSV